MNRATPVLLAVALVCSLAATPVFAAGAGAGGGSNVATTVQDGTVPFVSPTDAENTTNRLELTGEVRSEHVNHGTDLGTTLAGSDDELRVDHEQYVLVDSEFDGATHDEREALISAAYSALTDRAASLETREQEAVRAHADGERSTAELLQTLLRNHNEAALIADALIDLSDRSERVPGYSVSVQDERSELDMHRTVVRSQLETVARGIGSDTAVVAVETSDTGYAISMVGGNYVRETTRFDNRDTERPNQFDDITDAYETAETLYPWVFETGQSSAANEHTAVQLYQIRASHGQGQLEAYLDGGTGQVHREVQILNHNTLPTSDTERWSGDGLELAIDETPVNGPVKVTVTDAETGEPVTAPVTVDGVEVGETDADGTIWIVPPVGEYELAAATTNGHVNATVSNESVSNSAE